MQNKIITVAFSHSMPSRKKPPDHRREGGNKSKVGGWIHHLMQISGLNELLSNRHYSHLIKTIIMKKIILLTMLLNSSAALLSAQNAANKENFAQPELVKPLKIEVSQKRLGSMMERVRNARIPKQMPASDGATSNWETGMDMNWLAGLQDYWVNKYDSRKQEKLLNSYPLYKAHVKDMDIQFYTSRAKAIARYHWFSHTAGRVPPLNSLR